MSLIVPAAETCAVTTRPARSTPGPNVTESPNWGTASAVVVCVTVAPAAMLGGSIVRPLKLLNSSKLKPSLLNG